MKQLLLFLVYLLLAKNAFCQGWGETQKITPDDRSLGDEFGWNVVVQDNIAAVSAKSDDGSSSDFGAVYIYELDGSNNWVQTQKLISSDVRQFDRFGQSIAMDGNTMIIGARSQDFDENGGGMFYDSGGAAYIFERDGSGNWLEVQKLVSSDRGETFQALLGETVAISGNYAVVNAPREITGLTGQPNLTNAGACYIFEKDNNGVWQEVQKIVPSQRYAQDKFGDYALAIDGGSIVVGTFRHDFDESEQNEVSSSGAVYIFKRDVNGVWNETQKIVVSDREQGELFGRSVALQGDNLLVGASQEYLQGNLSAQYGAVYAYEQDENGQFILIQKIRSEVLDNGSKFGQSLDIDGNRFIVGAYFMNVLSVNFGGTAFIFDKNGDTWSQTAIMYDENVASGDRFGQSVALSGDFAFVGAFEEDEDFEDMNTLSSAGSAYVFDINEPNNLDPLLSILEITSENKIKIYPNPTKDKLYIDSYTLGRNPKVTLYDNQGRLLFIIEGSFDNGIKLPDTVGLYVLSIETEHGRSTFKIIKE